jgi:uncharacterized protein YbjT (DUF2867 family)
VLGRSKAVPRSIAVFGASGHIGGPLARHVRFRSPGTQLRLISSSAEKAAGLAEAFPDAQCHVADLLDRASLVAPLAGVEGVFVITPSGFDEARGMGNLASVLEGESGLSHIVRITGLEPELDVRFVPEELAALGATATQHHVAKAILQQTDLPITYLNIGASFMDNFLLLAPQIRETGKMIWPSRLIGYLDPRDVGEIAANLLLSPDERNLRQFHNINNGQDLLETHEVADLLSDVLKQPIPYDGSPEAFVALYDPLFARRSGKPGGAKRISDFIAFEKSKSSFLHLSDLAERLLGRKPATLRAWFMEHRAAFADGGR